MSELNSRTGHPVLVELLGNLLDNAHCFAASQVSVKAGMDGKGLSIRIADDGAGFNNPKLAAATGDRPDPERHPGLGIAIANEIGNAYGGTLTFKPRDADDGLSIEIHLPESQTTDNV